MTNKHEDNRELYLKKDAPTLQEFIEKHQKIKIKPIPRDKHDNGPQPREAYSDFRDVL